MTRSDETRGGSRDAIAALAAHHDVPDTGHPADAATTGPPARDTLPLHRPRRPAARRTPRRPPRSPAAGLPLLVLLAMAAAFFAWVSAEPAWLAAGRGDLGVVTVSACSGSGIGQRCIGTFTTAHGYTVDAVPVTGVAATERQPGVTLRARMVGPDARTAYAGDPTGLHFRWTLGLLLVAACGLAMVVATGAWRLRGRARRGVIAASLGIPLLMAAAMLAATF